MRVCIDARLISGTWGGVESVVIGLAQGLSQLDDHRPDDDYVFLAYEGHDDYLQPYVRHPCRVVTVPHAGTSWKSDLKSVLKRRLPRIAGVLRWVMDFRAADAHPSSDGTAERLGADVIHFPLQAAYLTSIPSIYHPHDLQHVHLPELFTYAERRRRERSYRAFCEQAAMVAVVSRWTARDVESHFGLPPGQVQVVPLAPIIPSYELLDETGLASLRNRLDLPDEYVLYPAQTWKHKNHARLIDALALLRERDGLTVPLVSTGRLTEQHPALARRAEQRGVADQIRWLGFVSTADLRALHQIARAVVIPTLFEAASGPLWDAFVMGNAAACSTVTSLPDQAGDAAILFDPLSVDAIASAVRDVWTNGPLRAQLVGAGHENVSRFSWETTARIFRAHYRRLAGAELTDADRGLMTSAPPF